MVSRFPLILDTQDSNKIKEIPAGDNLDLRDVSIIDVQDIVSIGTISAPRMAIQNVQIEPANYLKKSNDLATYGGNQFKFLRVAANGTSIEFIGLTEAGVLNGELTGDIYPNNSGQHNVGTSIRRFAEVNAVSLKGNVVDIQGRIMFDYDTGIFYIDEDGVRKKMVSENKAIIYSIIF